MVVKFVSRISYFVSRRLSPARPAGVLIDSSTPLCFARSDGGEKLQSG